MIKKKNIPVSRPDWKSEKPLPIDLVKRAFKEWVKNAIAGECVAQDDDQIRALGDAFLASHNTTLPLPISFDWHYLEVNGKNVNVPTLLQEKSSRFGTETVYTYTQVLRDLGHDI